MFEEMRVLALLIKGAQKLGRKGVCQLGFGAFCTPVKIEIKKWRKNAKMRFISWSKKHKNGNGSKQDYDCHRVISVSATGRGSEIAEICMSLQDSAKSCRMLQNPAKSFRILQNPTESCKVLRNPADACEILQNSVIS